MKTILITIIILYFRYQNQGISDMESSLYEEFQRQMDHQVQLSKARGSSLKKVVNKSAGKDDQLLKDNIELVATAEDLRKQLKAAEDKIRRLEKLFRDSHKKLSPGQVKSMVN